jgi:hypothetical protein
MNMTRAEHVTALFVIAMYHWFIGDKYNARNALEVAVQIATHPNHMVA